MASGSWFYEGAHMEDYFNAPTQDDYPDLGTLSTDFFDVGR